ncbi:MAG TPA: 4Fe-4S dicluster domain-containing protein [Vicinamibacteria bacterium]|nr:4Fe-4S dicluster domain-containing protein [Vicinamibacteria bacterium]
MAELVPAPFASLVRRMFREHSREQKIFDLPERKFWRGAADLDISVLFHGHRASNPLGPAAGPQDQMAQNVVLSWLAGSRILELKTVQINDRLTIPRPCIDATNVGYNVEWSQELRLTESLGEYVAGSMLVDMLRASGLPGGAGKADTLYDMSVGYDLAGIRSPQVRAWIEGMKDARSEVERLRREIPAEFAHLRDLDFTEHLSDQVTLSTFHGCPAHEIEGIARFLLIEMDVHVTVKLNPTLLGRPAVDGILHGLLGYHEIETRPEDFEKDLNWDQALEITDRLTELARSLGRTFQVKFSNTLVVKNHRSFFPSSEAVMYLSGEPLHVITLALVDRYRRVRPDVPISFSAGVDSRNFPDCAALGFTPVTTCTDLLRPGGYARLPKYLENLEERMRTLGVRRLGDYVVKACGQGPAAIRQQVPAGPLRDALLEGLGSQRVDLLGILEQAGQKALHERIVRAAGVLNTPVVVEKVQNDPRFRAERNRVVPRKIGSKLWLFDCINCDKCVPVCPNDANFVYRTEPLRAEYATLRLEGGTVREAAGGVLEVKKDHQLANFADFCNECGNCDTFCPEDGGPYVLKPRFFGSLESWRQTKARDGFYCRRDGGRDLVWGRIRGREYELVIDRERGTAVFTDYAIRVALDHRARRVVRYEALPGAPEGHTLEMSAYLNLALAADGAIDPQRANPVNAGWL